MCNVPKKVSADNLDKEWNIKYPFDEKSETKVYSVDTPPPTVSGSLHIGHVFSYTHTDIIARFKRMSGYNVFYPMGWDDNGLPTERRVQNYYNIVCDPSIEYEKNIDLEKIKNEKRPVSVSRQNFIELCFELSKKDEIKFKELWEKLGLSVDWNNTYQTIDDNSRKICQTVFLENLKNENAYLSLGPTIWDTTFRTAVAQAELEDREIDGAYYKLKFRLSDNNEEILIDTTRPELLPGCIALVAHPDDDRYKKYFNKTVKSPLFDVEVPVLPSTLAEMDKGTGIAMVCTFGDVTDVQWWKTLRFNGEKLPSRPVFGPDGRVVEEAPNGIEKLEFYKELVGLTIFSAKEKIVELLKQNDCLVGEIRKIKHSVKFFEKGNKPVEIIFSRQWYIKNGAFDNDLKSELIKSGDKLGWNPEFMKNRYMDWVQGLSEDWLISRQRFFGVPIPLWYKINSSGDVDYSSPIVPQKLPTDPSVDVPDGYTNDQRGKVNGFIHEKDVMDTWATSSLTPQIAGKYLSDSDFFDKVFPYSLRPQAQDIIRTWLFSTVLRSLQLHKKLPWEKVAISGFILDPDRKKMSKSKGNAKTPIDLLEKYSPDAVRYWAAKAKLGLDAIFEEEQMRIGRKLVIKLLNASKFALSMGKDALNSSVKYSEIKNIHAIDSSFLIELKSVYKKVNKYLDEYQHSKALDILESFFWDFCDYYIEIAKARIFNDGGDFSAKYHLILSIDCFIRMFAPFLPFTTSEIFSWYNKTCIHTEEQFNSKVLDDIEINDNDSLFEEVKSVIFEIHKYKSENQLSMSDEIDEIRLEKIDNLPDDVIKDIKLVGKVKNLITK